MTFVRLEYEKHKKAGNSRYALRSGLCRRGGGAGSLGALFEVRPQGCGDRRRRSAVRAADLGGGGADRFAGGDVYHQ